MENIIILFINFIHFVVFETQGKKKQTEKLQSLVWFTIAMAELLKDCETQSRFCTWVEGIQIVQLPSRVCIIWELGMNRATGI